MDIAQIYFRMQWIMTTYYDNIETTHYLHFYKSLSFIDQNIPDSPLKDEKVKNSKRTVFSFKRVLIILIVYFDFFDGRVPLLWYHFSLPASQYLNWIIVIQLPASSLTNHFFPHFATILTFSPKLSCHSTASCQVYNVLIETQEYK